MKKTIAIAIASIFASSAAFAAAATIGGITTTDLGADTTVVASCDSDGINIDFNTAFDAALGIQEVVSVSVTGIDSDCDGFVDATEDADGVWSWCDDTDNDGLLDVYCPNGYITGTDPDDT